jgi:two-component system, sensor histidine kinase and response regulator
MLSDSPWWLINTAVAVLLLAVGATLAIWGVHRHQRANQRVKALEAQRTMLQNLVRNIPDLVWSKSPQGVYLACNPSFERFFGAAEADIVGKTDADFVSPEQAATFRENDFLAMTSGQPHMNEEWITFAGSTESRLVETIKSPMLDSQGGVIGILGVARDITERERVAQELQRLRHHLTELVDERTQQLADLAESLRRAHAEQQTIVDAVPVGIGLLKDRQVVYCNECLDQMFGFPPGGMAGQSTRVWYPDDAAYEAGGRRVYEILNQGQMHWRDEQLVRQDGSRFWARITARLLDPQDPTKGVLGIMEDISVERATMDALREAKEAAEATTRLKSAFLANMSHEIRTPMNAIIGLTHLTLATPLDDTQRAYLHKIQGASQHLLGIVNDVLDLSKIESGKLQLERLSVDIGQILRDVHAQLIDKAHAKGLVLDVHLDPALPERLMGDGLRIGQVLLNFGSNAVKFTEQGRVDLSVQVLEHNERDVSLRFEVRDTGIGISRTEQAQLFESFQQADVSTTRQYGGTGLGLAISRHLAEQMGGTVGVSSESGQGSLFWFNVRLERASEAAVADESPLASASNSVSRARDALQSLHGMRVLVVEDNELNRLLAGELLQGVGLVVDFAHNGRQAVDRLAEIEVGSSGDYGLVFMDMQMPVMDGLEATRLIRQLPGRSPLPIVAMTANAMVEDSERCLAAGMNDYISKPFSPEALWSLLHRWLTPSQPRSDD